MVVREAEGGDYEAIIALLDAARLPTRDLTAAAIEVFLVASDAHELLGAIALEDYGDVGLVRSLVVKPGRRGAGVGTALVAAVEQRARDAGIATLVLLTETAMNFFGALGYAMRQREHAPVAVQASSEFASVCPASAAYMEKRLR